MWLLKVFSKDRTKPILGAIGWWQEVKYKLNPKEIFRGKNSCDLVVDGQTHWGSWIKKQQKMFIFMREQLRFFAHSIFTGVVMKFQQGDMIFYGLIFTIVTGHTCGNECKPLYRGTGVICSSSFWEQLYLYDKDLHRFILHLCCEVCCSEAHVQHCEDQIQEIYGLKQTSIRLCAMRD